MSHPAMATFPIGARDDNNTVPLGNSCNFVLFKAASVICLYVSEIYTYFSLISAGVTQ